MGRETCFPLVRLFSAPLLSMGGNCQLCKEDGVAYGLHFGEVHGRSGLLDGRRRPVYPSALRPLSGLDSPFLTSSLPSRPSLHLFSSLLHHRSLPLYCHPPFRLRAYRTFILLWYNPLNTLILSQANSNNHSFFLLQNSINYVC